MCQANVVGIDLGTSAVKLLQRFEDGSTVKVREPYREDLPEGWWNAVCRALCRIEMKGTVCIGLAAQVGTYVLDGKTVIGWDAPAGKDEIHKVRGICEGEAWEKEISMRHPQIISYPLPRLLYIREHYPDVKEICQPKEWILQKLTGEYRTDPYSWRGLCRLPEGVYSKALLEKIGADITMLPPVAGPAQIVGHTKGIACASGRIPAGIPVCTGLNDFFASLLGMGMHEGMLFDITGTSEHLGIIDTDYMPEEEMVSGPWLSGFARYGVTASSGASLDFCSRLNDEVFSCPNITAASTLLDEMSTVKPPVFLPYLNGERAPIWNPDARGVFFGMSSHTGTKELAYSVMEGVCFSLFHVYEALGSPKGSVLKVSGGASANPLLGLIKAELMAMPVSVLEEKDTTALGAAMLAMVGGGWYADLQTAMQAHCAQAEKIMPSGSWRPWFMRRYDIYKSLYPALRSSMADWAQMCLEEQ